MQSKLFGFKQLASWFKPLKRQLLFVGVATVLLIATVTVIKSQDKQDSNELTDVIEKVGQLTELPKNEVPLLSTLVDKSKADQPFLSNAKDGDKILIYPLTGRAIVYRPSVNKIVNIGAVTMPSAKVFIRIGSSVDISTQLSRQIQAQAADFTVVSKDRSPKPNYQRTLVIDLTGLRADLAERLAQIVSGEVSKLPSGESRPDAELLVITGS